MIVLFEMLYSTEFCVLFRQLQPMGTNARTTGFYLRINTCYTYLRGDANGSENVGTPEIKHAYQEK